MLIKFETIIHHINEPQYPMRYCFTDVETCSCCILISPLASNFTNIIMTIVFYYNANEILKPFI